MSDSGLSELLPVLEVAIGPVILVSGIGLLLLSMTNRYGRVIDRSRDLVGRLDGAEPAGKPRILAEIELLYRRARLLRLSILSAGASLLLVVVLMIVLFVAALLGAGGQSAIPLLFLASMGALFCSLAGFLCDLQMSLDALKHEVDHARGREA
ncbi:MAG: DUF2721 domain-containing protein [Planctomycetota bacterium]